jgi:membrane protein implicated in regulation of membrane protease activity
MADDHGRDDYHDPTRGLGGAAPARSALTLRLVLAVFGTIACAVAAIVVGVSGGPWWVGVALGLLAAIGLVDAAVVVRRKRRGEPG